MAGVFCRSLTSRLSLSRFLFHHPTNKRHASPFISCKLMSTRRPLYEYIEEVETIEYYQPGGYHPVQIRDRLHHERYRIVHKLGHGSFSTIWLARDEQLSKYVAIKVGTAFSDRHELDVLSRLTDVTHQNEDNHRNLTPVVLDHFNIHGPNGTHPCFVMAPARCSLSDAREASSSGLFQPDVARSLAAQLAIAIAYIHDQKCVHGDLHLGNILLRLPSSLDHLSEEQLYDEFGEPELEPIIRSDGKPLPPGVPSHAVVPVWLGKESEEIVLSEAKLLLVDFGVAFFPAQESRFKSQTPLEIRPPEARFEPTTPLSFASDIWSLACSIWAIFSQRSLFDSILATQDDVTCSQVDALGLLPPEWWGRWEARSKYFTETGQPVGVRSVWTWDRLFENGVQEPRDAEDMLTPDAKEKDALFKMLRWMLAFRPNDRPSASQVLETEWMRDWALPEYRRGLSPPGSIRQDSQRHPKPLDAQLLVHPLPRT